MTVNEFLSRLDGVKGGHGQWTAKCPAHDDRRASLSVSVGEGGRVLLNCHAGCSTEDICAALGLTVKDLFMEDKTKERSRERPQIAEIYPYHHDLQKIRYSDKSFLWRRPDGKGGWIWNRQGVPNALFQAGELTGVVAILYIKVSAESESKSAKPKLMRRTRRIVRSATGGPSNRCRRPFAPSGRAACSKMIPWSFTGAGMIPARAPSSFT